MNFNNVYVIRDKDGNYISPRKTEVGWYFVTYTGIDSGFTCYISKDAALSKMDELGKVGYKFHIDSVDYSSIKDGKIVRG